MAITAMRLFDLAREAELRVGELYAKVSHKLPPNSEEAAFFARLSGQEKVHAAWVDEMRATVESDLVFPQLDAEEFQNYLRSVADVEDEIVNSPIGVPDALEIVLHLEESVVEQVYLAFPDDIPGLAPSLVQRMINSCRDHITAIGAFRAHCLRTGQAGVHTPSDK